MDGVLRRIGNISDMYRRHTQSVEYKLKQPLSEIVWQNISFGLITNTFGANYKSRDGRS